MPSIAPSEAPNSIRRDESLQRRDDEVSPFTVARRILRAAGVERSNAWLTRTIRIYRDSAVQGMPFDLFLISRVELNEVQRRRLAERADMRYLLSYADPTGETAIRNVMREAR